MSLQETMDEYASIVSARARRRLIAATGELLADDNDGVRVDADTVEAWLNREHDGDCVKQPVTCLRCWAERNMELARRLESIFASVE